MMSNIKLFEEKKVRTRLTVKKHKDLKGLKTQNLHDHMNEAELIFTVLAEMSTRQIAESVNAKGLSANAKAGKKMVAQLQKYFMNAGSSFQTMRPP